LDAASSLKSLRIGLKSNATEQHQDDNDDQDRAKDTGPGMSEPIAIAPEASTEPAEQEDDKKNDEDCTK
jgi:hypothetical protein